MMEPCHPPSFNWSISNQAGSSIRTCEPLHINVDRTPIPGIFPSYLLTVFSIDNGKEPKSVVINPESRGNGSDWVVDESIGSRLILSLKDANGGQGRYLPHIFEVVAGNTTECVIQHPVPIPADVHSDFSCGTTISEQSDDSNTLRVDVHGGMPPYETTLIWLTSSGFQVGPSIPFYQPPLVHSINAIERDTLLTAVSDSNGKWAVGSSTLHFGSRDDSSHRILQNHSSITPYGSSDLQSVRHQEDHTSLPPSTLQTVMYRRSSDDGPFIIVVDVIALALLIIVTVAIVLCDVARRRRHRLAKVEDTITLQDVRVPSDLEAARETNTNKISTDLASSSQKTSLEDPSSGAVERAFPAVPPPTPAAFSRRSRASSQARSLVERSTALSGSPSFYGDHPVARSARDTYRSDVQSDLSHKTSFGSNKTAKLIAKFHAPYFGEFYEASPTDTRSGMLSRNLSKSSVFTMRTDQQMTPVPPSAVSTRPSWYQISADAPDVPALDCKDQDVQPHHR